MNNRVSEVPDLLKKWNYEKNTIPPDRITTGSGKKVWWICEQGHSYEDSVKHQNTGRNCPVCAGKQVVKGFNDLASAHPELMTEWDFDKNTIYPDAVTSGSNKQAFWKCPKGHAYMMQIMARVRGRNCPVCAGKIVIQGTNDLATVHPELISEWDVEKNILLPSQVTTGSNKKIWWICKQGHSWKTSVKTRVAGSSCPICAKSKPSPKRIQLRQLFIEYPQLQQEYDYEKNRNVSDITTKKKLWWKCQDGHSWRATISNRKRGCGCPYCKNKFATPERNLAICFPDRLNFWDWERNVISPYELLPNSDTYVHWKCQYGHTWDMSVNSATDREYMTCPYCSGRIPIPGKTDLGTLEPEIAAEWDYKKNRLLPTEVTRMSAKKVWWRCQYGHSYRTKICSRSKGTGCPVCAGRKRIYGKTDDYRV